MGVCVAATIGTYNGGSRHTTLLINICCWILHLRFHSRPARFTSLRPKLSQYFESFSYVWSAHTIHSSAAAAAAAVPHRWCLSSSVCCVELVFVCLCALRCIIARMKFCRLRERMADRHNGPNRGEILYSILMTNFSFAFVFARTELVHCSHVWLRVCSWGWQQSEFQTDLDPNLESIRIGVVHLATREKFWRAPSSQAKRSSSHDAFTRYRVTHTNWQANVIQAMIPNFLWKHGYTISQNIHPFQFIFHLLYNHFGTLMFCLSSICDVLCSLQCEQWMMRAQKRSTRTKTRQFTEHILIRLVHGRMYSVRRRFQKAKNVKVDLYHRCERFIEHDACGRCFRNFLLENNEIKSFNVFHASLFWL